MKKIFTSFLVLLVLLALYGCSAPSERTENLQQPNVPQEITIATTTSTRDSGLLENILPEFEADKGIDVKVIAVGTGKALTMGRSE